MPSRDDARIIYTGPSPRGWHRLQQAAECLQKYAWSYEAPTKKGLDKASPPLAKGTLIHLALAQHYIRMKARQTGQDPDEWCEPEEAVQLISQLEGTSQFASVAIAAYHAYKEMYPSDEEKMLVIDVEELATTYIRGKYLFTGRLDLAYKDRAGRIFGLDHKTTSRLTSAHKQFYSVSGQLLGYNHMAKQKYGEAYTGFVVNLIQHGASPQFERIVLPRSPNLESRFEQTVTDIEESIERMLTSGRDYDDWPKAMNELTCYHRYGACEFMSQCRFGAGAKTGGSFSVSF